jgi:hypothetical protein
MMVGVQSLRVPLPLPEALFANRVRDQRLVLLTILRASCPAL